jgi:hypothetical protein
MVSPEAVDPNHVPVTVARSGMRAAAGTSPAGTSSSNHGGIPAGSEGAGEGAVVTVEGGGAADVEGDGVVGPAVEAGGAGEAGDVAVVTVEQAASSDTAPTAMRRGKCITPRSLEVPGGRAGTMPP